MSIGAQPRVIKRPYAVHSHGGLVLTADDAGVHPAHPFFRVVTLMAFAMVQKPLGKASQLARASERLKKRLSYPPKVLITVRLPLRYSCGTCSVSVAARHCLVARLKVSAPTIRRADARPPC
jgi:hypothetical protein